MLYSMLMPVSLFVVGSVYEQIPQKTVRFGGGGVGISMEVFGRCCTVDSVSEYPLFGPLYRSCLELEKRNQQGVFVLHMLFL